jgi:hypothetical protein
MRDQTKSIKQRGHALRQLRYGFSVPGLPCTVGYDLTTGLGASRGLAQQLPVMDVPNDPMSVSGPTADLVTGARTIPYFTYTATDPSNGNTYTLDMVGTDPALGTTTTVPVLIIPLRLNFANGGVLDATSRAAAVANSPIFVNSAYTTQMAGGTVGQYGDVLMRAQAKALGSGYHVLLEPPTILPTEVIDVPQNHGRPSSLHRSSTTTGSRTAWLILTGSDLRSTTS